MDVEQDGNPPEEGQSQGEGLPMALNMTMTQICPDPEDFQMQRLLQQGQRLWNLSGTLSAMSSAQDEYNCSPVRDEPPEVKRRVKALLKMQLDIAAMRADLARDVQRREFEFAVKMKGLEEKRQSIVVGTYEPTDGECDLTGIPGIQVEEDEKKAGGPSGQPQPQESNTDLNKGMENMAIEEQDIQNLGAAAAGLNSGDTLSVKGIPNFWSEVLQGSSAVSGLMEDHDLPILRYLENITLDVKINNEVHPPCVAGAGDYILRFHFGDNPFFTNKVLTKSFTTQCSVKMDAPMSMVEEPWPISATGCDIKWIEGRNVTMQVVQRKQRSGRGGVRFVVSTVEKVSFFNFFKTISAADVAGSPDLKEELEDDFRIGESIRKTIIPFAPLFYSLPDADAVDRDEDGFISDGEEECITLRKRDSSRKPLSRSVAYKKVETVRMFFQGGEGQGLTKAEGDEEDDG